MKKRELITIVLLLLSGLFITCTEKEELNPVNTENYSGHNVGVSEAFIPLEEENVTITNYNASGNVSLTYTGTEPKFIENKSVIVVDLDTMGYLRKVVSVQKQGNTINLTTEQAYFSDVFKSISFKLSTKSYVPNTSLQKTSTNAEISKALTDENGFIHPVKIVYHSRLGKATTKGVFSPESISESFRVIDINTDFSNTDLYGEQGDNVHFYISEGYAKFQSDAVLDFDIDHTGEFEHDTEIEKNELKKFEFYLDTKAEFLTKLNLDMQASYSKEGKEKIFDMKKISLKFFVAAVPVWITMDCDIYGKYTLSSDAKVNVDWGFKSTHNLKIGGTYTKATDDFIPISDYDSTNVIYPMNIEGEINANARFEIYPRAEVMFYGFFGPYAEVVPFVEGNYNAAYQSFNNNFLAWNANVDLGLDMRVGLKLTFLYGLFNEEFVAQDVNCFNTTLWAAPYDLTLLSNIPASSGVNSLIELKYKVIDKLGNPVLAAPIHFSGNGTTSSNMVITNIGGEATVSWNVGNTEGVQNLTATIYEANGTIINQLNHSTVIASNNQPPEKVVVSEPANGAINISINPTFNWESVTDPEGDPITYSILLGKQNPLEKVAENLTETHFTLSNALDYETKYYYQIISHDNQGNSTESDVWTFTTETGGTSGTPCPDVPKVYYEGGPNSDVSGDYYNTVLIDNQCWIKENLSVGTKINSNIGIDTQTDNGTIEKYCHDNNESNCDTYGGLYQWNEAMQYVTTEGTQGICPSGWHIPTYAEMQTLATYVNDEAAKLVDESQTATTFTPTNETGFSALFAGSSGGGGFFLDLLGSKTFFWSSTENGSLYANYMYMFYNRSGVYFFDVGKYYGYSVRCLKD